MSEERPKEKDETGQNIEPDSELIQPENRAPRSGQSLPSRRKNIVLVGAVSAIALIGLLFIAGLLLYRIGYVDRYIANQIKATLSRYGIRAEIKDFRTRFTPRTVEMTGIELFDEKSGAKLGTIDRLLATVRIEDLYALNLRRNVNLEALTIDGLKLWVRFDEEGRSNFRNLRLPAPDPNRRILFSYSTAKIDVKNSVIFYDNHRHDISGEARNIVATVMPDNPNAPEDSWMNTVTLSLKDSTFTYNGNRVENIDLQARGRVNQTRAEIEEVVLRSPIAESRLHGRMDNWRELKYQMDITSTVDLTQTSELLQPDTTLRGTGKFVGTVTGNGPQYQVTGKIESDSIAADGIRLKNMAVDATVTGEGNTYEARGKAIADLLSAGYFELNSIQLAGQVMGTGTDFRWLGDLRAAAAKHPQMTITGLILEDAKAESRNGTLTASSNAFRANRIVAENVTVQGARATGLRATNEGNQTNIKADQLQAEQINSGNSKLSQVRTSQVTVTERDGTATASLDKVTVGSLTGEGIRTGSINIAGVRLTVRDGRITGTSSEVNAGTVHLARGGHVDNVRLNRPTFSVEPQGRYRVTADLSLGGGVLGEMKVGTARSRVVASNGLVQLNDLQAEVFDGRIAGNAALSTNRRGNSRLNLNFDNVEVGGVTATLLGRIVPVTGKANGRVDMSFPGTSVEAATGTVNAQFTGRAGDDTATGADLSGQLALRADRGLFTIDNANFRTGNSELNARGYFSLNRESDLNVRLSAANAAELQELVTSTGLFPELESRLFENGIGLSGPLNLNARVTGRLSDPLVNGDVALGSLLVNGRNVGSLSATVVTTPDVMRIVDGRITEEDGGIARFELNMPRTGENNTSLRASLERIDPESILAVVPGLGTMIGEIPDINSQLSGNINVNGIPGAMEGSAEISSGAGTIGTEQIEGFVANATFNRSEINLSRLELRTRSGSVNANGSVNLTSKAFNADLRASNVRLEFIRSLLAQRQLLPQMSGIADLTAQASGSITDVSSYRINFDGSARDVVINGRPAGNAQLTGRTVGQQLNVNLTSTMLGSPQVITASVNFGSPDMPATIETRLNGADLTALFATLLPASNVTVSGRATGTLRATGNLMGSEGFGIGGMRGTAHFEDLTLQIEDIQLSAERPLLVQFSPNEVFFEKTRFTGPGTNISFGGTAALSEAGKQNLRVDGELNLRVLNGLSPNIFVSGAAQVAVRVNGTYADPRITGSASVGSGSLSTIVADERISVTNIKTRLIFTSRQAQIDHFTASLGGGKLSILGGALLEGLTPSQYRLTVRGDDLSLPFPRDFRSLADANLVVSGTGQGMLISGLLNLNRAEYTEDIDLADFINRRRQGTITETTEGGMLGSTQLDVRVEGRDALVIRNNLAETVGSVSLHITGASEDPVIAGRISTDGGTVNFRNERYEIVRAFVDLPARRNADPYINLQAEADIKGYRVIATIVGPLSQPTASLRSDPALPQADVVALVTTGDLARTDESASVLSQSSVGTAASLLTETLINRPARRATEKLFGLTTFEIDPQLSNTTGAGPSARLTVGRQINRNLTVTYSTNLTSEQAQVLALEYRLSNRLSFVAQYDQGSQNNLRTGNNNFSFEIRFRKRF